MINVTKNQDFLILIHENSIIPTMNNPTRVTKMTATIIDHILTNSFVDRNFKTALIKSDVSDQFPSCYLLHNSIIKTSKRIYIYIYI